MNYDFPEFWAKNALGLVALFGILFFHGSPSPVMSQMWIKAFPAPHTRNAPDTTEEVRAASTPQSHDPIFILRLG
jgi:hypothetical protein